MWVRVSRCAHRMPAVQIEILHTFARPDARTPAPLNGDPHLFIGCDLVLVFGLLYCLEVHLWIASREHQACSLGESEHEIHILYRLSSGSFNEIIYCRKNDYMLSVRV